MGSSSLGVPVYIIEITEHEVALMWPLSIYSESGGTYAVILSRVLCIMCRITESRDGGFVEPGVSGVHY